MSVRCEPGILQLLLRLDLFRGLSESELSMLLDMAELVEYAAEEYPIREGEQDHHLFVLLSGQARIYKRSYSIQKIIQDLGPGECFGEMSLVECRSRSASVKTLVQSKLLKLDGDKVTFFPDIAAKLYRNIAVMLSQRLRHANELLTLG
jgi:CRP/FNR family transcriptional regulator, cyclic AMP receptor protein